MNTLSKLFSLFVIGLLGISIAQARDAKVVKISGAATVQLAGQSGSQPVTEGMLVPEGSVITTGADGQVFLEAFSGAIATIQNSSSVTVEKVNVEKSGDTVTSQEALLDLKEGTVISTIDPRKKSITHYGVRTPKGVAAARGTVYGVTVQASGTTVATMSGTVTLNLGNGVTVDIPLGTAVVPGSDTAQALSQALIASGQTGVTVSDLLQQAVQVVADNVAARTSAVSDPGVAATALAAVVSAASSAMPDQAGTFTQIAVQAATSTGNTAAADAVVQAALQAAPNSAAAIQQAAPSVSTTPAPATTPITPVDPTVVSPTNQ
ncbi:MAG TPA: FecR domain-containing protein [Opitutus sp.]|nr:FecR domain-containing protein [Opitutus sp.]